MWQYTQTFLVAVHDRSKEIVIGLIIQWILPGPTKINDCWAACSSLRDEGYTHFTVNHSVTIVDETAWVHTNTMESTWKQVKALLRPYNHRADYVGFLAEYMISQKCEAENLEILCKFIQLVQQYTGATLSPLIHSDVTCVCVRCATNDSSRTMSLCT